jgi:hypothetical protein
MRNGMPSNVIRGRKTGFPKGMSSRQAREIMRKPKKHAAESIDWHFAFS